MTISGGGAAALEPPRPPPFRAFDSTRRYAAAPRHATLRHATLRDSLGRERERPTRRRKTRRERLSARFLSLSLSVVRRPRPPVLGSGPDRSSLSLSLSLSPKPSLFYVTVSVSRLRPPLSRDCFSIFSSVLHSLSVCTLSTMRFSRKFGRERQTYLLV